MSDPIKITHVDSYADWQALYVGDTIFAQDHKIGIGHVIAAMEDLPGQVITLKEILADEECFVDGEYPESLSEVVEI